MPKISIIMPVYNKQDYIQRSLDSVLNQDFSDYELIAVDDGSMDNSLKILEEYQSRDSRITVIHTENHGVSHARNVGLDNSNGEYLTFVDADDELRRGYLNGLLETIQQTGVDLVIQGITRVYPDRHTVEINSGLEKGIYLFTDLLPDFAEIQKNTGIFGYCVSKLFSGFLAKDIRFDEELNLAEDFDYYLKLYRRIKTVYLDDKSNYLYYQDLSGSSVDIDDKDIDYKGQFKINGLYREFLLDNDIYYGNNKFIIARMINSSAYHMLLYSDGQELRKRCLLLNEKAEIIDNLQICRKFQRTVLNSAIKGNYHVVYFFVGMYRVARAIKRRISR